MSARAELMLSDPESTFDKLILPVGHAINIYLDLVLELASFSFCMACYFLLVNLAFNRFGAASLAMLRAMAMACFCGRYAKSG